MSAVDHLGVYALAIVASTAVTTLTL